MIYIMFGIIVIGVITIVYLRKKWGLDKTEKLQNAKAEFVAIDEFNEAEYIEKTFKDVIHSVMIEEDWETEHGYEELVFKKSIRDNRVGSLRSNYVTLKVKYELRGKKFKISNLFLTANNTFSYKVDKLDLNQYKFFYNTYVDYINSKNEARKMTVDKSLELIRMAVGKDTIRDSKIDDILNGD